MRPALVISARDNVATALEALDPGRTIDLAGRILTVLEPIPRGHKVALAAIGVGEPIVKYGSPIGIAVSAVAAGAHVHTHNVSSARGRGDLTAFDNDLQEPRPRLAEPDERSGPPTAGDVDDPGRSFP